MPFQKGQSGNPSGRPHIVLESGKSLTEIARGHTEEVVTCLMGVVRDPEAPHAARVTASLGLLDRGWGRPAQQVMLTGDADHPVSVRPDLSSLTDDQLRVLASIRVPDRNEGGAE